MLLAPVEVRNHIRFRGTPERGWYEGLDPSKICPCTIECASGNTPYAATNHLRSQFQLQRMGTYYI
jgi:hypothetical protein